MPNKPDKYGIKLHVLAESLSGYVWNLYRFFHATIYIKETVLNLLDNLIKDIFYIRTIFITALICHNYYFPKILMYTEHYERIEVNQKKSCIPFEIWRNILRRGQIYIQLWCDEGCHNNINYVCSKI